MFVFFLMFQLGWATKTYLIDLSSQKGYTPVDSKAQKIPLRVYGEYVPSQKRNLLRTTNVNGDFEEPPHYLAENSVLWGSQLGSSDLTQRFKLTAEGEWIKTSDAIEYHYWIFGKRLAYTAITSQKISPDKVPSVRRR